MLEQQGYYFHPHTYNFPIGHPQLDFDLLAQPGDRLFKVKLAHFRIWENDNLRSETLSHRVRQPGKLQVFPGRFSLETFDGQLLNGFCFGGELEIIHFPDFTRCHLISPAPIGNLSDNPEAPQYLVISELAAMVATERAGKEDDEAFWKKLAQTDPFQLFIAGLAALEQKAKKLASVAKTAQYRQLAHQVSQAVQTVKDAGEWPDSVPDLAKIFE